MPNYLDLLKALNRENVKFVIVGGFAMVVYGASTVTNDLDFAIALDNENGAALIRALAPFHPYPPKYGSSEHFIWDERSLFGAVMSLMTTAGHIDILRILPEVDSFDGLFERSQTQSINGETYQICSIEDLVAMKLAAGRTKDLEHIRQLQALEKLISDL